MSNKQLLVKLKGRKTANCIVPVRPRLWVRRESESEEYESVLRIFLLVS